MKQEVGEEEGVKSEVGEEEGVNSVKPEPGIFIKQEGGEVLKAEEGGEVLKAKEGGEVLQAEEGAEVPFIAVQQDVCIKLEPLV